MNYGDHNFIEITQQTKLQVAPVAHVMSSASSSSCRAVLFDKLDTAKMGLTRQTCQVEIWQAKLNFGYTNTDYTLSEMVVTGLGKKLKQELWTVVASDNYFTCRLVQDLYIRRNYTQLESSELTTRGCLRWWKWNRTCKEENSSSKQKHRRTRILQWRGFTWCRAEPGCLGTVVPQVR